MKRGTLLYSCAVVSRNLPVSPVTPCKEQEEPAEPAFHSSFYSAPLGLIVGACPRVRISARRIRFLWSGDTCACNSRKKGMTRKWSHKEGLIGEFKLCGCPLDIAVCLSSESRHSSPENHCWLFFFSLDRGERQKHPCARRCRARWTLVGPLNFNVSFGCCGARSPGVASPREALNSDFKSASHVSRGT